MESLIILLVIVQSKDGHVRKRAARQLYPRVTFGFVEEQSDGSVFVVASQQCRFADRICVT